MDIRSTDAKGRISLPKAFANATVIIDQLSDSEIRIRKAVVIPENEAGFYEESTAPLTDRDRDRFLEILDNPGKANPALRTRRSQESPVAMAEWQIERLGPQHDRSLFSCGKPTLDNFILKLVGQYEKRNLGRTYVAARAGEVQVRGYYTIASGAVPFKNLPPPSARKLPKHPVPVILLARLAVDLSVQGQGLGEALLLDALGRSLSLAETLGIHAVEVDAIDQQAKDFYKRYGFQPLLDAELHLYLPVATIRDAFDRRSGKS